MSYFIKDTNKLEEMLTTVEMPSIDVNLKVVFVPFFRTPETGEIVVLLKRELSGKVFSHFGRRLSLSCLSSQLPMEPPITAQEAFMRLQLGLTFVRSKPMGGITVPDADTLYETLVVEVEPVTVDAEKRGVVKSFAGECEVGAVKLQDIGSAITSNMLTDSVSRLLLIEFHDMITADAAEGGGDPHNQLLSSKNTPQKPRDIGEIYANLNTENASYKTVERTK